MAIPDLQASAKVSSTLLRYQQALNTLTPQ
jgi:hypothetical protein